MNLREWSGTPRTGVKNLLWDTFQDCAYGKRQEPTRSPSQDFHFQLEDLWMTSSPGALQRPIRIQHLPWFPAVNVDFEVTKNAAEASYEKSS